MELPLLKNMVVVLSLAVAVLYACHRLRLPAIVGFLITGVLAGPHGLGLLSSAERIATTAEIGIVLLLFTIGAEFSFKSLWRIRRIAQVGGTLQVALTIAAGMLAAGLFGAEGWGPAVFIGFLLAPSSTAIVLRLLQERSEVDSPHGKTAVGILILQDLAVVPMVILLPLLAGKTGGRADPLAAVLIGLGLLAGIAVLARWVVPFLLYQVSRTRNREIFLFAVLIICFFVAWLTSLAGLSLALGAFLAGLIISESEYSHHALGSVMPFRDVFSSFFFISVGMLLDVPFLSANLGMTLLVTAGVFAGKALICAFAGWVLRLPLRAAVLAALALAQIGEFSFILARTGLGEGLISEPGYQLFLAVSIITMAATPFVVAGTPLLIDRLGTMSMFARMARALQYRGLGAREHLKNHTIIVGFGITGRNVAKASKVAGVPYTIIEMNPDTVRRERRLGEPIHYGDASNEAVLLHVHVRDARVILVAIPDPVATRRTVAAAKRLNPRIQAVVRTQYVQEIEALVEAGADEVVPAEFETAVEIFARILAKYLIPRNEIERLVAEVRAERSAVPGSRPDGALSARDVAAYFSDTEIASLRVEPGAPVAGKPLGESNLRRRLGVTVIAIRRGAEVLTNPDAGSSVQPGDILVLLGTSENVRKVFAENAGGGA
ncbi:MAG TPA: potassium transporter KefB [Planctomycetes bacterium]|nr:potassium transporter KefB [Planctomycetota bacterium]